MKGGMKSWTITKKFNIAQKGKDLGGGKNLVKNLPHPQKVPPYFCLSFHSFCVSSYHWWHALFHIFSCEVINAIFVLLRVTHDLSVHMILN